MSFHFNTDGEYYKFFYNNKIFYSYCLVSYPFTLTFALPLWMCCLCVVCVYV